MASALLELIASHELRIASVVSVFWRSDSRALELAADSSIDADIDARYTGTSLSATAASPSVTLVQPTTIIARAAKVPVTSAATRARGALSQRISTVQTLPVTCPFTSPIGQLAALNETVHTRQCACGRIRRG
jgi:hypothetical protein